MADVTNPKILGSPVTDFIKKQAISAAGLVVGQSIGIPQISQFTDSFGSNNLWRVADPNIISTYQPFISNYDFRSAKPLILRRIDGTGAAFRGSKIAGVYAAASVAPTGVYSIFNLDGAGKTGRGWGDHGNPNLLRNDFTAMAGEVRTRWNKRKNDWVKSRNPLDYAIPFVGDKVQVIDFGQRTLKEAYLWKPKASADKGKILGALLNQADQTQDFIKFMLTGPKLRMGSEETDDIIIFRAILDTLEDSYNPSWTDQKIIGRADPNYIYQGVSRSVNLNFKVFATTREEMKPIWRKLNALAGYTAPTYNPDSIAPEAPWMRITIGDLFHQQAVVINSLSYTLHGNETTWEINVEKDPEMFELPHYVSVNLDLKLITDVLPQKGGKFYALNDWDNYGPDGNALAGNKNWLSDPDDNEKQRKGLLKQARELKAKELFKNALSKVVPLNIKNYKP